MAEAFQASAIARKARLRYRPPESEQNTTLLFSVSVFDLQKQKREPKLPFK